MYISQQNHKALNLLRDDPARFAAQGTVVATWRTYRGRHLGPYYRLTWRENGRQHAIYLGRQSPLVTSTSTTTTLQNFPNLLTKNLPIFLSSISLSSPPLQTPTEFNSANLLTKNALKQPAAHRLTCRPMPKPP